MPAPSLDQKLLWLTTSLLRKDYIAIDRFWLCSPGYRDCQVLSPTLDRRSSGQWCTGAVRRMCPHSHSAARCSMDRSRLLPENTRDSCPTRRSGGKSAPKPRAFRSRSAPVVWLFRMKLQPLRNSVRNNSERNPVPDMTAQGLVAIERLWPRRAAPFRASSPDRFPLP